jgi:hypothetical protein
MIEVAFPEPDFRIRREEGKPFIFDRSRKSWVPLTEEEWVRQNFMNLLVTKHDYPSSCMAVEKEIRLNDLKKRFDLLIYDGDHQPWMLVECKAPGVPLSEDVLQQLLRYHITIPVPYLVITNGTHTIGWKKEHGALHEMHSIPPFIPGS